MRFKTPWVLNKNEQSGFTLIELLIVIVILAVLATMTLVALNPFAQLQKGQDAKREQDLKQIATALDTYYNDKNSYPTALPALQSGTPVYMKKIPNDPSFANGWKNYGYLTDGTSRQWNVLFARVSNTVNYNKTSNAQEKSTLCPLIKMGCPPTAASGYNYCIVSGNIDTNACAYITGHDPTPL